MHATKRALSYIQLYGLSCNRYVESLDLISIKENLSWYTDIASMLGGYLQEAITSIDE